MDLAKQCFTTFPTEVEGIKEEVWACTRNTTFHLSMVAFKKREAMYRSSLSNFIPSHKFYHILLSQRSSY